MKNKMKKFKRIILALIMALFITSSVKANANSIKDININDADAAEVLSILKIMQGTDNGFEPTKPVTREQMAKMMSVVINNKKEMPPTNIKSEFSDIEVTAWSNVYINYCASKGIIAGVGNGKFEPTRECSYGEAEALIKRAIVISEGKSKEEALKIQCDFDVPEKKNVISRADASQLILHELVETGNINSKIATLDNIEKAKIENILKETLKNNNAEVINTTQLEKANSINKVTYNKDTKKLIMADTTMEYQLDNNTEIYILGSHAAKIALEDLGNTVRTTEVNLTLNGSKVEKVEFKNSADVMRKAYKTDGIIVSTGKTTDENYEASYEVLSSKGKETYYSEDKGYEVNHVVRAYVTGDVMTSSDELEIIHTGGYIYKFNSNDSMKMLVSLEGSYDINTIQIFDLADKVFYAEIDAGEYDVIKQSEIKTIYDDVTNIMDERIDGDSVHVFLAQNDKTDDYEVIGIVKTIAE